MPSQELEKVQQAIRQVGRTCDSLQAQMVQKLRIVIQKREELEARVAALEKKVTELNGDVLSLLGQATITLEKKGKKK